MAEPANYDIKLVAGDDYQITVRLLDDGSPIDTNGYTFTAQVRDGYLPDGQLVQSFTVTPVSGGAKLSLSASQTSGLGLYSRLYWDVQSSSPDVRTWLSGRVYVTPEVTE
mgnify:CR=1 FL=1